MFGYIPPDVPFVPPFSILARAVAGSFLAMAGFSLYLAHGRGIRWRPFLRRLAVLTVAAAVITAATMIALPDFYIYFGILHSIALSSVLGLAFLRLPAWATLTVAAGIIALPFQIRFEMFDPAWLRFVGLGTITPFTADFEPLFPWFGVYLLGMALARMFTDMGWLRPRHAGSFIRSLGWIGRQSLWIYLAHQPERLLRVTAKIAVARFIGLQIDPQRRPLGPGARQAEHDAPATPEEHPQALCMTFRAVNRVAI